MVSVRANEFLKKTERKKKNSQSLLRILIADNEHKSELHDSKCKLTEGKGVCC